MNGTQISTRRCYKLAETAILALVGVIMASIIVPTSLIAMLKANPANGKQQT